MEVLENIYFLQDEYVNIYLVFREEGIILIDAGVTARPLVEFIEKEGLSYKDIKLIILTHYHMDHTGGLNVIKERVDALIAAHKDEKELIIKRTGVSPTMLLEDGQSIYDLEVIHTPGHTPGHIVLIDKKTKALFAGDIIYEENGQLFEIDHKYSMDPEMNRKAIKKIINYDFKHVLPSHGKPIIDKGKEKLKELVERLEK